MADTYGLTNKLNLKTGQWEYAPRFVTVERGRIVDEQDDSDRCADCDSTEAGSCFYCRMD
jgi:hypothetical protein